MTTAPEDAYLVRAAVGGDRQAFAVIYDRYSNRLHDFCVGMLRDRDTAADCVQDTFVTAATKLAQLREPERLRSWLYAIARSECLARLRSRQREHLSEDLPEMPSEDADLATLAGRTELAELIGAACGGLADRDRAVLELAYRQGLDGPDLADALGVTAKNANTLVERMRDTIERSLGALLVCRGVQADPARCSELAELLGDWDGAMTVLLRKRAARHIDGCAVCSAERGRLVTPAALLGSVPVIIPAPAWLREQTLQDIDWPPAADTGETWWPEGDFDTADLQSAASRRVMRGAAAVGLIAIGVGAAVLLARPQAVTVVPVDATVKMTQTTTTSPSTAAPPPPPPTATTPTTTTPSALPRSGAPPTTTTFAAPAPTVPTTDDSEPAAPTTTAPPSVSRTQPTTQTSVPQPDRQPPEEQPDQPDQDVQEPIVPTVPSPPPDKPSVPTIERPTPGEVAPISPCTPLNPCQDGPPVFS